MTVILRIIRRHKERLRYKLLGFLAFVFVVCVLLIAAACDQQKPFPIAYTPDYTQ